MANTFNETRFDVDLLRHHPKQFIHHLRRFVRHMNARCIDFETNRLVIPCDDGRTMVFENCTIRSYDADGNPIPTDIV